MGRVQFRAGSLKRGCAVSLTSRQRRELSARGHKLEARLTLSAEPAGLSESVVEHVRRYLAERELIKVRLRTDDRSVCEASARELAERVPCELVQRVGRVVLLYNPPSHSPKS